VAKTLSVNIDASDGVLTRFTAAATRGVTVGASVVPSAVDVAFAPSSYLNELLSLAFGYVWAPGSPGSPGRLDRHRSRSACTRRWTNWSRRRSPTARATRSAPRSSRRRGAAICPSRTTGDLLRTPGPAGRSPRGRGVRGFQASPSGRCADVSKLPLVRPDRRLNGMERRTGIGSLRGGWSGLPGH
jgi:hypothetical protein